jgi:ABC-2 type transport system permease protein
VAARQALHAEWTKLVSVPAQSWLLVAITGLMTGAGALVAATQRPPHCPAGTPCPMPDTTALALSGVYFAQLAAIVLAVALVSSEYQPRVILLTLAARPRRGAVFTAKTAVAAAGVLAAGAAGVAGALAGAGAVLGARGLHAVSWGDPALQRAAAGTLSYLLLVGLLAAGLAWALRHQAAAAGGHGGAAVRAVPGLEDRPDGHAHPARGAGPLPDDGGARGTVGGPRRGDGSARTVGGPRRPCRLHVCGAGAGTRTAGIP